MGYESFPSLKLLGNADCHSGWHLNKFNSVILIRLNESPWDKGNTCAFHLESSGSEPENSEKYGALMNSNVIKTEIDVLLSMKLNGWSEVCTRKVESEHRNNQSKTIITGNCELFMSLLHHMFCFAFCSRPSMNVKCAVMATLEKWNTNGEAQKSYSPPSTIVDLRDQAHLE